MNLGDKLGIGITLADLERAVMPFTVYYVINKWCPKVDEDGKECAYYLKDHGYYIVHPDLLPKFRAAVEATGMFVAPYDFGKNATLTPR